MRRHASFGGHTLVADTSAWARAAHPAIRDAWSGALAERRIATTAPVMLELLRSARDSSELDAWESRLRSLRDVALTRSVTQAAIAALRELARVGPGFHRVPAPDVLIAAAAADAGLGVLHYDRHFDRLAQALDFESVWIAPPGTL